MNDYMPWVIGAAALMIAFLGFFAGWVTRVTRAESAIAAARQAQQTADKASTDLSAFKEHVAGNYASITTLDKMEERVVGAINRLADRLDRIFEQRSEPQRSAPRSRATKG